MLFFKVIKVTIKENVVERINTKSSNEKTNEIKFLMELISAGINILHLTF